MSTTDSLHTQYNLDFYARQIVEGFLTGMHRSPFHGFSVEFAEHRQYTTGESTRHIDWKLYGRTNKLFTKRFEEETNLRCQLVIDRSSSMLLPVEGQGDLQHPNKLTFACYGAAVLSELLVRQCDAVGLSFLSDGIDLQTQCHSNRPHQQHLLHLLDEELHRPTNEKEGRPSHLPDALHLTAEALHRRSLVVIFTDAILQPDNRDPLFDALRHLRHCKHEVILFHTLNQALEMELGYEARPTLFIDLESGRKIKANPAEIAPQYHERMAEYTAAVKQHAIQYHIDYQPVDISRPVDQLLLPFLLQRAKSR